MAQTEQPARRIMGASAVISILQKPLDEYADRIARGYANVPVDAEALRDAIILLGETCATSPDPEPSS